MQADLRYVHDDKPKVQNTFPTKSRGLVAIYPDYDIFSPDEFLQNRNKHC